MVKLKAITRTDKDYERETKFDMHRVTRTHQRNQHQFSQAREYQRAVVASKISKIFAKPFLYALNDHSDGISCFGKIRNNLEKICSGSFNGEVFVWDLLARKPYFKIQAFEGSVKGISFSNNGEYLVTVGDSNLAKIYKTKQCRQQYVNGKKILSSEKYITQGNVTCVDFSYKEQKFVTSGEKVQLWDVQKSIPIEEFSWGFDTILAAKINPVQHNLIVCTALDRGIYIHDMRSRQNLSKTILINKSQCIDWNPMEPFNFICGNEDSNIYGFDIRKMDIVKNIYKDHIGSVMSIDHSPTGKQFVSGSFDKTIKIYDIEKGYSKETYHSKRMQKVFGVMWSQDNNYIYSGSEDTNIRIWKSISDKKIGELSQREQNIRNYRNKLLKKFKYTDEIKKIKKTHLPKYILNAKKRKQIQKESRYKKIDNMRINNEEIFEEPQKEKEKKIIKNEQLINNGRYMFKKIDQIELLIQIIRFIIKCQIIRRII